LERQKDVGEIRCVSGNWGVKGTALGGAGSYKVERESRKVDSLQIKGDWKKFGIWGKKKNSRGNEVEVSTGCSGSGKKVSCAERGGGVGIITRRGANI